MANIEIKSPVDFIHFCRRETDERLKLLPEVFSIKWESLNANENVKINYILDFLKWWDDEYHSTVRSILQDDTSNEDVGFFGGILHQHISDDIKAILGLLLTRQHQQANVVLRRVIEYTLYTTCLDIISRFGTAKSNLFDIYWHPDEWKELLKKGQRMGDEDINNKIKLIYELNKITDESTTEFRKRFFREGNEFDLMMLMCKFSCKECESKENLIVDEFEFKEPEDSDEGIIEPRFKHWGEDKLKCEYCRENDAYGLVYHVLTMKTIFLILKKFMGDGSKNALSNLEKVYSILSTYFVHFATNNVPTDDFADFRINNKEINLLGFDGIAYILENISMILCDYFIILKSKFEITDKIEHCNARKRNFSSFGE